MATSTYIDNRSGAPRSIPPIVKPNPNPIPGSGQPVPPNLYHRIPTMPPFVPPKVTGPPSPGNAPAVKAGVQPIVRPGTDPNPIHLTGITPTPTGAIIPNTDGSPPKGTPGYLAPGTGLLTVGQGGPAPTVAGYTPSNATASTATSTGYDPSQYVMTPDQTVEGRAAKIAEEDSVLMQQARVRANQDAQSKGLLSSSLAVQAGQNAVLEKAIPIASQDATAYNQAMVRTADSQNAEKNFRAAAENQASVTNAGLLTTTSQGNAQEANAAKRAGATAFNDAALQSVDAQTKSALGLLDAQNRQLLQENNNAANMFAQTVTDITNISTNATLSQAAKDAATATALNLLREGLGATAKIASTEAAAVKSLDLSKYFNNTDFALTSGPTGPLVQHEVAPAPSPWLNARGLFPSYFDGRNGGGLGSVPNVR